MITITGTLSKAWLAKEIGVSFDRDYYFEPMKRHAVDVRCNEYAAATFPDLPLFYGEANLTQLEHYSTNQVLIGGIQPNMILGILLGAKLVCPCDKDADISPACMAGCNASDLVEPEKLLDSEFVHTCDSQIRNLKGNGNNLRPIPPFFWDTSGRVTFHGVLTTAQKLFGEQIFMDMVTQPRVCHEIMQWIVRVYILLARHFSEIADIGITGVHVGECSACMISAEMFEKFIVSVTSQIGKEFGPLRFHSCGNITHLIESTAKIRNLHSLDLSGETPVGRVRDVTGETMPISIMPRVGDMEAESFQPILDWAQATIAENKAGELHINFHLEPGYNLEAVKKLYEYVSSRQDGG